MKTALCGFGFMGYTHAVNIIKTAGLELSAIIERNSDAVLNNLNDKTGNIDTGSIDIDYVRNLPVYSSLEECLLAEQIDVVDICLPTLYHYNTAKIALNAGKHVLIEKPFVLEPEHGEELIKLAEKKEVTMMIAHVVRFMSEYEYIKEIYTDQRFGKLEYICFNRVAGNPSWGNWKSNQKIRKASGGAVYDLLIHDIDFANYLLGNPHKMHVKSIPGLLSDHDFLNIIWEYKNGPSVFFQGGLDFHCKFPFESDFKIKFKNASIKYSSNNNGIIYIAANDNIEEHKLESDNNGYLKEIEYFSRCINNEEKPVKCTAGSSLEAIKLCQEICNSEEENYE